MQVIHRCPTEHRDLYQSSTVSLRIKLGVSSLQETQEKRPIPSPGLYGSPQHCSGRNACSGAFQLARVHTVIPATYVQALRLLTDFCHIRDSCVLLNRSINAGAVGHEWQGGAECACALGSTASTCRADFIARQLTTSRRTI